MKKNIDFGTVADLYDIYVKWETDVPFFREICASTNGEVLELMSGTGRLSISLLESGARLCCIDYSAEMLEVLRRKLQARNLVADVREEDVRTMELGRTFERILLPFHSFSEIIEPTDRAGALIAIRRHLAPGGWFILTAHNPAVQIPHLNGERRMICDAPIPGSDATLRVWSTARYNPGEKIGEALQEYEILDDGGRLIEQRTLQLRFVLADRAALEREIRDAGFLVVHLWGDYARGAFEPEKSPHMIWELEADV